MKATLKRVSNNYFPLEYGPSEPTRFTVDLDLIVGAVDSQVEEIFTLVCCSASWLQEVCEDRGPIFGRHYLVVSEWDWSEIKRTLDNMIAGVEGVDWQEVAEKIGRFARWEFEDYRE